VEYRQPPPSLLSAARRSVSFFMTDQMIPKRTVYGERASSPPPHMKTGLDSSISDRTWKVLSSGFGPQSPAFIAGTVPFLRVSQFFSNSRVRSSQELKKQVIHVPPLPCRGGVARNTNTQEDGGTYLLFSSLGGVVQGLRPSHLGSFKPEVLQHRLMRLLFLSQGLLELLLR